MIMMRRMMTMITGVLITKECVVLESHCYAVLLSSAFHVDTEIVAYRGQETLTAVLSGN